MRYLLALLFACGGSKPVPTAPLDEPEPTPKTGEPFALAAVVYNIDVFAAAPPVALPSDAKLDVGSLTSDHRTVGTESLTYSIHTWDVILNDDFDRFDKDVAPLFKSFAMPADTALVWSRVESPQAGPMFTSVAVRTPPLLVTNDLASAVDTARPRTVIDVNSDKSAIEDIHVVNVTLTPEAATRYAEWTFQHPGEPIAIVVYGRVAMLTTVRYRETADAPPPKPADVASFVVEFQGIPPNETRREAVALEAAVAQRTRK